ncbi:hypothetical protein BPAE_0001g02010 [Botrytis paeoniae]|uniref:Uncharacterized protein n=1 Tax=Botrytis paeoniae TaxID=278948 RepID=A0A4Z1G7A9_9HELO|nr:hypothetical protein BPAE_0001g02010 [Botrytis paeoniae]
MVIKPDIVMMMLRVPNNGSLSVHVILMGVGARQIQVSMTSQNTPRTNWMVEKGLSRHQTQT